MKGEVIRWGELARRGDADGKTVLLDGGLVTIRSLGSEMPYGVADMKSAGSTGKHKLEYRTPWGSLENCLVRSSFFTAVLGSGSLDQEEGN